MRRKSSQEFFLRSRWACWHDWSSLCTTKRKRRRKKLLPLLYDFPAEHFSPTLFAHNIHTLTKKNGTIERSSSLRVYLRCEWVTTRIYLSHGDDERLSKVRENDRDDKDVKRVSLWCWRIRRIMKSFLWMISSAFLCCFFVLLTIYQLNGTTTTWKRNECVWVCKK